MDFHAHFNDAQRLADSIDDWESDAFAWQKAYVAAVFAAVAYEEVPQFELKKSKRAKLIPCDRFQAHVSRWETEQRRATPHGGDERDGVVFFSHGEKNGPPQSGGKMRGLALLS